jgi:hypothetical protein
MAATVEDLTVNWEEDGELRVKEVAKHCLSKGSWATVMFLFQEMDPKTKDYRAPKIGVRRYRKLKGEYKYQSKFNISSEKQALEMVDIMQNWFGEEGEGRKLNADILAKKEADKASEAAAATTTAAEA